MTINQNNHLKHSNQRHAEHAGNRLRSRQNFVVVNTDFFALLGFEEELNIVF